MKNQIVTWLSDQDEEFIDLLVQVGSKRSIALALLFLANTAEVTSRDIERGTDLRQSEVSISMRYLQSRHWVTERKKFGAGRGRPLKVYSLAKPFMEILSTIEEEKRRELKYKIFLTKKLQKYVSA